MNQLLGTLPNIVYYNHDHSHSATCTGQIAQYVHVTYTLPGTWTDFALAIETGAEHVCFHVDQINRSGLTSAEFVSAVYTIHRLCHSPTCLKIMVLITPATAYSKVQELRRLRITGIGLDINYYPVKEVADAVCKFIAGRSYWPKHIIGSLPGAPAGRSYANTKDLTVIHVTARQQQVLGLIRNRGLSNKQIARALSISENTVKMHVGDLMRAHGVKNRIQLAVLAQ